MANSVFVAAGALASPVTFPLGTTLTETALGNLQLGSTSVTAGFSMLNGANAEGAQIKWASNALSIGGINNTGAARNCFFTAGAACVISPNNGIASWQFNTSQHFLPITDNTSDIGASTPMAVRRIYAYGLTMLTASPLLSTAVSLTDQAGVGGGTLLNAPSAGNPTKWIAIDDNGTTRKIPTWT